jgi:CHAD domain-containing protein
MVDGFGRLAATVLRASSPQSRHLFEEAPLGSGSTFMAKGKRIPGLDCSAPADKMVRLVLRSQLRAMCNLRETALDWSDPEGVHDMRVLSRRMRSAVSDFRPYLRKRSLPRLKLRSIAWSLGNVRDEDVALLALEELKSKAKEQVAAGIEILIEERREKRKQARAALQQAIRPSVVDNFRRDYLSKLRAITISDPKRSVQPSTDEALSFGQLGVHIIDIRLKEFISASRHIYFPFEIKELHELRILAKRLRYALELFAVCWGDEMSDIAKEVALLQTALGELHDCDVWIESLGRRLKQTARRNILVGQSARLKDGAVWLVRHFSRERMEHYRDALALWHRWEADGLLQSLRLMLASDLFPAKVISE